MAGPLIKNVTRPYKGDKPYLTTGQMAHICQVAPRTVSKWCDGGVIKNVRRLPGSRDRRVHRDDFIAFLREVGYLQEAADLLGGVAVLAVCIPPARAAALAAGLPAGWIWEPAENAFAAAARFASLLPAAVLLSGSLGWGPCREMSLGFLGAVAPPRLAVLVPEDVTPGSWLLVPGLVEFGFDADVHTILHSLTSSKEEESPCPMTCNGSGTIKQPGPSPSLGPVRNGGPKALCGI